MRTGSTEALLRAVRKGTDRLLLSDRAQIHRLVRNLRRRLHERKPADRLAARLEKTFAEARERAERREKIRRNLRLHFPAELPVSARREEIRRAIEKNPVVVVCGATGSGKTTQLPKIAVEAGFGRFGRIGVTQPRRLAASALARRVAFETAAPYGGPVGCKVRFDDRTAEETVIKFMTDGILLAETRGDRLLLEYDLLIIDEVHERSLNIDFLLGYLKELLKTRTDLRVVLSSATLDARTLSRFFDDAPVIEVEGRTYPVEDVFLPPEKDEELSDLVLRGVEYLSQRDDRGDILVFLPGEREIREAADKLNGRQLPETDVLPLFGRLSMAEQQRVFRTGDRRRIVLATNVAETSITIPGIRYVIDSGLARISRYNPRTQVQGLQVEQISRASARQRRGRCGRTSAGVCVRLYSRETLENAPAFTDPEIRRSSLAGVILQMEALGLPPLENFPLPDPPQAGRIREGYRALFDIGAIDEKKRITDIGRELALLPVDPHLGRMLLQAEKEGALAELLVLAAFLSIQDVRERPTEREAEADAAHRQWEDPRSDFLTILNLWKFLDSEIAAGISRTRLRKLCKSRFLNYRRVMEWRNLWQELRRHLRERGRRVPDGPLPETFDYGSIHRSILAGIPANIGTRGERGEYIGARDRRFYIFPGSGLFRNSPEWVMAFALVETTRLYARTVAEIEPQWLEQVAPHLCKSVYADPAWDPEKGFVYAEESVVSGGLCLVEKRRVHYGSVRPREAREIFIRDGLVPGNLRGGGPRFEPHRRLLEEIRERETRLRRPGALFDFQAVYEHFDRLLPADIHSTRDFERWLRKTRTDIALPLEKAMLPRLDPIDWEKEYPDEIAFGGVSFPLLYTFDPDDELDGVALVCAPEDLPLIPSWAPEWLVPGYRREKVERLLRTLPRNLRAPIPSIAETARRFAAAVPPEGPFAEALVRFLEKEFSLPLSPSDFSFDVLPPFLRTMKIIESDGERILRIHTALSEHHRRRAREDHAERAFARWALPPSDRWPGDAPFPEFVTVDPARGLRGYPALTAEDGGVGRRLFADPLEAAYHHRAGLARLFRLRRPDAAAYAEKRPPLAPAYQLTLAALDPDGLADLLDAAIVEALTDGGRIPVRDPQTFETRAEAARGILYDTFADLARRLADLLDQREKIVAALDTARLDETAAEDMRWQLEFLFRPGFLRTDRLFTRYPRYLRALARRIERARSNPAADLRKLAEIEPFQDRLNDLFLAADNPAESRRLIELAMLLEEFRINRFAPEVKTDGKISPRRLEEAFRTCGT